MNKYLFLISQIWLVGSMLADNVFMRLFMLIVGFILFILSILINENE